MTRMSANVLPTWRIVFVIGIVAVTLVGTSAIAVRSLVQTSHTVAGAEDARADLDWTAALQRRLTQLHLDLLRRVTLEGSSAPADYRVQAQHAFDGNLHTLFDLLSEGEARFAGDAAVAEFLAETRMRLEGYEQASVNAIQMVSIQFSAAASLVLLAEARFWEMRSLADEMEAAMKAEVQDGSLNALSRIESDVLLIVGIGGGGALLALLSVPLAVRPGVRSVRAMARAMERIASGHTDTEVPGLGRADAIGRMAACLLVFREQAEQLRQPVPVPSDDRDDAGAALAMEADRRVGALARAVGSLADETCLATSLIANDMIALQLRDRKAQDDFRAIGETIDQIRTVLASIAGDIGSVAAEASAGDTHGALPASLSPGVCLDKDLARLDATVDDLLSRTRAA